MLRHGKEDKMRTRVCVAVEILGVFVKNWFKVKLPLFALTLNQLFSVSGLLISYPDSEKPSGVETSKDYFEGEEESCSVQCQLPEKFSAREISLQPSLALSLLCSRG